MKYSVVIQYVKENVKMKNNPDKSIWKSIFLRYPQASNKKPNFPLASPYSSRLRHFTPGTLGSGALQKGLWGAQPRFHRSYLQLIEFIFSGRIYKRFCLCFCVS